VDHRDGAFQEVLPFSGPAPILPRRARVQARQIFVYATAARLFRDSRWAAVAQAGYAAFQARYRHPEGTFANLVDEDGRVLDPSATTYEQAFVILAMAALAGLGDAPKREREAERVLDEIASRRNPGEAFRELGEHRFQANANMHLLEAAMDWERVSADDRWVEISNALATFAMDRFIDPGAGLLREFFDETWRPQPADKNLIEPGHLFEWSWLLGRWGRSREDDSAVACAERLFRLGLSGVDDDRGVVINALWEDLAPRDPAARLWPQTEYLKAALLHGDDARALAACNVLAHFLAVPLNGAWRDKMGSDGAFRFEPAPASSFYHILVAVVELLSHTGALHPDD
jgi:mannose-6-phosphate isomerase